MCCYNVSQASGTFEVTDHRAADLTIVALSSEGVQVRLTNSVDNRVDGLGRA